MDAQTSHATHPEHDSVVVNRNLAIEVSLDEILDDLLFPATRGGGAE